MFTLKYSLAVITVFFITISANARCCCNQQAYCFYLKASLGVSSSESVNVLESSPPWNTAIQRYNTSMGSCSIVGLNLGCEFANFIDFEISISNLSRFEYRKFQTPVGC